MIRKARVAINGFGRIGRDSFRANLASQQVEIVAINDLGGIDQAIHLLKYDSIYRKLPYQINKTESNTFSVGGQTVICVSDRDPLKLPWRELDIDIVLECTGVFRDRAGAEQHLRAGAKKVIISAPGKGDIPMVVMGVNHNNFETKKHDIISNASCTTNCLAPTAKVLHQAFGINKGLMTTIHSMTNDQMILDSSHKSDFRRARAASLSAIPTETGAAEAIGKVLPELNGKLDGTSIRIPTPTVSIVDLVCELAKSTDVTTVNNAFKQAAQGELQGILAYNEEPLVSADYIGDPHSAIVDGLSTMMIADNLVKVIAWYDNEWGYSCRLVELAGFVGKSL